MTGVLLIAGGMVTFSILLLMTYIFFLLSMNIWKIINWFTALEHLDCTEYLEMYSLLHKSWLFNISIRGHCGSNFSDDFLFKLQWQLQGYLYQTLLLGMIGYLTIFQWHGGFVSTCLFLNPTSLPHGFANCWKCSLHGECLALLWRRKEVK